MEIEFVDELPPVDKKPIRTSVGTTGGVDPAKWSPGNNTGIFRMANGEDVTCDCGKSNVVRTGDTYNVSGSFYHLNDAGYQDWLVCGNCNDKIKISPILHYVNSGAKSE